uniref:Uncharacterized protein n=1 Tax=Rhizophora mucronata TaxID=61149 RepID=A0A2P2QJL4_RHIMU
MSFPTPDFKLGL